MEGPRGLQVLLDYGLRTNAELLSSRGLALAHNPHDAVPITLAPRDENAAAKAALLAAANVSAPFGLSVRALQGDSDLLVALRVIAATPTELARSGEAFRGQPLSARNERKWRLLLRETVEALLMEAEQETSAEEDRRLLAKMQPRNRTKSSSSGSMPRIRPEIRPGGRSERRRRAALVCRLGEKMLLRAVLDELNQQLSLQRKQIG
jgi:hypothetical protein